MVGQAEPMEGEMVAPRVIAIDGPAGSGKSTVARAVAERLGLEYLDLYLVHFPISLKFVPFETRYPPEWVHDPDASDPADRVMVHDPVPIAETWRAMEQLVDEGLVKNIGVCNFNVSLLTDLLARVGPDATVLLPLDVAPWSVLFEGAPTPLVVRPEYLGALRARFGEQELERRQRLAHTTGASPPNPRATALLVRAIRDYDLAALALAGATRSAPSLTNALRRSGFEPTFEDAMKRLESLVNSMESGEAPLSELVERYEEGTALAKLCRKRLEEAELKVKAVRERKGEQVAETVSHSLDDE